MSASRWMILTLGLGLCGCFSHKPAPLPPPATPQIAERMQAEFQEVDPTVKVGLVAAVKPADRLAAVSHMDGEDLRAGDAITFMGSDKSLIGNGTVVQTVNDLLIVRYSLTTHGLREGDLAVRVKM